MSKMAKATDYPRHIQALHQALSDLVRIYQFRERMKITCYAVSVTQCHVLETLVRLGPLSIKSLADELYLDNSTTSRVIDALEKKGYVRRSRDPDDARAVSLKITRQGRALYGKIDRELMEATARLASDFEPDICQATAELMDRFAQAAVARFAGGKTCPGHQSSVES